MLSEEIAYQIGRQMGFAPTAEQEHAMRTFAEFITFRRSEAVMILRGSAGTGKTTLAGAIVRTMVSLKQKVVLLAPTGRAAKVFGLQAGCQAFTIHRKIYRQKTFSGENTAFNLNDNLHQDTLFVVDEASMISNNGYSDLSFGSGCLLDDLIHYIYSGRNCRMMLIGDRAQLPPVGDDESPALCDEMLEGYGLTVWSADLNEVLRQSRQSGILYNATVIRSMITHEDLTQLPKIRFSGFTDIKMVPGAELVDQLSTSYAQVGEDETMVVTRSNKRANIYNQGIRNMILDREEVLESGDMLMVVKNNYYWTKDDKQSPMAFIANGDRAVVYRVRNTREFYGFHFADVWLRFPDYDDYEMKATLCLDSLTSEAPALTREQQERLFNGVLEDYADIPLKADRMKRLREDPYYNSLQVKYAYAATCHKAQGGGWQHVYIDQGYMTDDMLTPDYIHWLYTAFTRATDQLFLVNWPKTQTEDGE